MEVVKECARLCELSYDSGAVDFVTAGDFRYGVFDTKFGRIVVIRGTANVDNWLTDLRVTPARTCGGYIGHKGFITAFRELCNSGIPLANIDYATGHSMGGALATQLAERTKCKLITFGSPRVYWRFGRAPELNHIRVIRDDDPVPMVPKFMYSHRVAPLLLQDDDHHLIQIKDHSMKSYIKALGSV